MRTLPLLLIAMLAFAGVQAGPLDRTGRGLKQGDSLQAVHEIIAAVCNHIGSAHGGNCTEWDADGNLAFYRKYYNDMPHLSAAPTYGKVQIIKPANPPDSVLGDVAICENASTNSTITCNKAISYSATDSVNWSTTNSLKIGVKTSMSIPGIGSDELSFEYSFSQTVGQTTSKTHTFSDTCTATVLPGGCVKFSMVVEVSKAHVKIPMSLALYGGVGLHHDPAISGVPDDDGNARTHYFRWRNIGWIIQYALQHNLIDAAHGSAAAWTFENPSAIQGSYAYWSTVLDVQGAEIGTSTTIATDCNVDPLRPDAAPPDAARLPAPKVLTPRITGAPPAILSKPALSRPAFLQMAHAASVNAQTMLAQGKLVLSV